MSPGHAAGRPSGRCDQDLRFARAADGTRLAFAAHGHGPPLVRAAHWLTNIDVDWQTPMWRPWFDAVGKRLRFYRYDSRGCGLSDHDATDASLDVLVGDLEAVVDAAKLDKFALLGTSQGGAISIAYAVRHPERVSDLVLLGAFARGPLRRNPTAEGRAAIEAEIKMIELGWGQDNPAYLQPFTNLLFPNATPEQARSFNDLQRMSCSPPMPRSCRSRTARSTPWSPPSASCSRPINSRRRGSWRVCKPGGQIGLANWTPDSFVGQLFKVIGQSCRLRPA